MADATTETGVPERDGIYGWIPEDVYHADRGSLSVSGAKLLLPPSCPAKFRWYMDNPQSFKRAWDFGSFFHLIVLGKGVEVEYIDASDYRTKAAREARDRARADGKVPILVGDDANDTYAAEMAKAQAMADAVLAHPVAGELLTHPRNLVEQSLYATDPETGVRLRGRIDAMHFGDDDAVTLIDVKTSTTASPREFERKAADLRYHLQADWYRGLMELLGLAVAPRFLFVVVEKEPPYLVSVTEFDTNAIDEAARLNRQAIDTYARCVERNEWPHYPNTEDIVMMSLPPWAFQSRTEHTTLFDLIDFEVG